MEEDIQIRACLTAAKSVGLVRVNGDNQLCPGSDLPSIGWYGAYTNSGDYWRADLSRGGPWSAEFVSRLGQCGLIGIEHSPAIKARLTKAGRSRLRATRSVPLDVARLVVAARNVAFTPTPDADELRELDRASEAFAAAVPWDGEPPE